MTTEEELKLILEHYKAAQEAGKIMMSEIDIALWHYTEVLRRLDARGAGNEGERILKQDQTAR